MKLGGNIKGLEKVQKQLATLTGQQAREVYAKALNDTAFQHVRPAMQQEMRTAFDRPTPFILRSPRVFPATPDKLEASIAPTYWSQLGTKGGKQGVDPQQVLQAQEAGGRRADKRSESALRRAGYLLPGFQSSIPANPYPGSTDAYGNLRGAFLQQLLSYLQAFTEGQGYKANMKAGRRAKLEDRTTFSQLSNRRQVKAIRGRAYFVSHGRLRGQHLPAGVWAKSGVHGVDVRPVLLFVRTPMYQPRLSMRRVSTSSDASAYLSRRLRFRIRQAAGV
ncbi:hypothetical protein [Paracidovorax wautersii]|uniref:Uncharacterized protein n=1 Tax=Paracidovorax wautersii TaxID=1177982 RepID=A0A1I2E762_9BURK|nr:hypothetical protein [Paracidovorax wautersii]SFE88543.1 hypothetical protein SAMN04489711_106264 [Paracidovorax wautersii]